MTTIMRVILYNDSDGFAGIERHICTLAQELRRDGVDAVVACPEGSPLNHNAVRDSLPTLGLPRWGPTLAPSRSLARHIDSQGTDVVVHVHSGRAAVAAALVARHTSRCRCVKTQHFLTPAHLSRAGPLRWPSKIAHRWVDGQMVAFIAISNAVREQMLLRKEAPPERITIVPNGLHPPDVTGLPTAARVRQELGIRPNQPWILSVARLEAEKDLHSLIDAMGIVVRAIPSAVCTIAGEGSLREKLAGQIRHGGLEESVRLLGFRDDAMSLINAADLFVLPSLAEPFGLAIVEAMSLGKPVIATRAGGPLEIVVHAQTGLLVPPANPAALADAIASLMSDEPRMRRMGAAGRERFEAQFTARGMAAATAAVYRQVLGLDGGDWIGQDRSGVSANDRQVAATSDSGV